MEKAYILNPHSCGQGFLDYFSPGGDGDAPLGGPAKVLLPNGGTTGPAGGGVQAVIHIPSRLQGKVIKAACTLYPWGPSLPPPAQVGAADE